MEPEAVVHKGRLRQRYYRSSAKWGRLFCVSGLIIAPASLTWAQTADFNGDGFADLAVGVPGEDTGGRSNDGGVNVLYGSAGGLQATGSGGPDDQLWGQDSSGVEGDAENRDTFGTTRTLAEGDFNGDGFADLAAGVPEDRVARGGVNVLYGSAGGLQATGSGGPDDQLWEQDSPGVEGDAEQNEAFGFALIAADFNGDGFADLAVGVPDEDTPEHFSVGSVNVLYGSAGGLQATGSGGPDDQLWGQNSPGVEGNVEVDDRFGRALTAADFNGDGFADLAVGVPDEDTGGRSNDGGVNVLYGSAEGLQATGSGGPDDQLWGQNSPGVEGNPEGTDVFGSALTAADFNGDGFADLAVGVPGEGTGGHLRDGGVNVLYGSAGGLQATGSGGPDDQLWGQDSPGVEGGADEEDAFGGALIAADFNNDGTADLAVGVSAEDTHGRTDDGGVNVLYGSAGGLQATGSGGPDDQLWGQDSSGVEVGAEADDRFGFAFAAGDFSGDGFADLAVGVPGEDTGGRTDDGGVNVLYGSAGGLQATGSGGPDDQLWGQNSPGVEGGAETGDLFGWQRPSTAVE